MTEHYDVRFEITPGSIEAAFRLHQATLILRYRIVAAVLAIVGVGLVLVGQHTFGVALCVFGVLMLGATWARFVDRWIYGRGARGLVGEMCEYDADEEGIHYSHALGMGLLPWSSLTEVRANDQAIVLRRDRYMAASLPTSAFESPAECSSFLAFARSRVAGKDQRL